ncbi:MAG: hypothetical protein FJY67_05345 [Calditrichaeota bacterium]|nr:hypothetical protein [Calditrichota bacterium]
MSKAALDAISARIVLDGVILFTLVWSNARFLIPLEIREERWLGLVFAVIIVGAHLAIRGMLQRRQ